MSDKVKTELISVGNTFVTTFISVVSITLAAGSIQWTGPFWLALLITAARAAVKAVIAQFLPQRLGGVK